MRKLAKIGLIKFDTFAALSLSTFVCNADWVAAPIKVFQKDFDQNHIQTAVTCALHEETSKSIFSANHLTGFHMCGALV